MTDQFDNNEPDVIDELVKQFRKNIFGWNKHRKGLAAFILPVCGALILLIVAGTSFYTVEPEEEAVIIRFGRYISTEPPGLHFKLPLGMDKVIKVPTKRVLQQEFGFRLQEQGYARKSTYNQESLTLTGDLNVADVEWIV